MYYICKTIGVVGMYKIIKREEIAPKIILMEIEAPRVAASALPGQFVIVKVDETSERIPLTICDYDEDKGTVTIVVQVIGASTVKISTLQAGDSFENFVGPLGNPSEFIHEDMDTLKHKKFVFIAGGVGSAPVYPQVKWLLKHGVPVDVIIGGRSKDFVLFENEMKKLGAGVFPCTDDGSYGFKGLVTNKLKELVDEGNKYDEAIAIGPMIMMKFACIMTKQLGIKTTVSLNAIMVDGTGMCGACRVSINGVTKFTCVDGPEFDGHSVDFDEAIRRQAMFKDEEYMNMHKAKENGCAH
jgi:ferredoxin--NADP+ reductase